MRKRLLIALVVLILLLPIALAAALLYTETGVRLVADQLSRLERIGVTIEGVSGTLAGPLRVERFELDRPRVHVLVRDIVVVPQLRGLLLQTIRTKSLTAAEALVELREADLPPPHRPPRFLPRFLRIDARGAEIRRVRYVHVNGTAIDAGRVRGRATITSHRLRIHEFDVEAERFDARGDLTLYAARPLGMTGAARGRLRLPRAELALSASVDGTVDRLEIAGELQSPSRATATALFTRPEERWRLEGEVASAAFALDAFLANPPFSLRNVALQITASAEEIHAIGALGVPQVSDRDMSIDARGRYADRLLEIRSAELALNDSPARVHASGAIALDADAPTLDATVSWRSLQWPLTGDAVVTSASGVGSIQGPLPYTFKVEGEILGPAIPAAQGAAIGVLSKQRLALDSFDVRALDGRLSGVGVLELAQPRAWSLSARGEQINPRALHQEFPGAIDFAIVARGSRLDKTADFALDVQRLAGVLRNERVRGAGAVERSGARWQARNVDVRYGDAHLTFDGAIGRTLEARWSLDAPTLARLWPDAAGSLQMRGSLAGPRDAPHIVATASGEKVKFEGWGAGRFDLDVDLDVSGGTSSRVLLNAQEIARGEPFLSSLRIAGSGGAGDHTIELEAAGPTSDPRRTPPHVTLQATGAYENKQWSGSIASARLTRDGEGPRTLASVAPARLAVSPDLAKLEALCFALDAGRICAEGDWRRSGEWHGVVSGYEIPLAFVLPPATAQAEYAGRIEGRIRANGAPGRLWEGDAGMRIIDAAIIYRPPGAPPQTLNLGTGGLAATATPERINFSFGVQAFTDTFLYANAQLQRRGPELLDLPLEGDVRGRAADANILPLVFPEIDHAAGLLTANATIAGTLAAPEIDGRIELTEGEFDSYRVNLALRDLKLAANLANTALNFQGSGRAGDGRLDVDGRFVWRNGESHGDLHLRGQDLLVADLPDYRVVASPDLRFSIEGERMSVAGDVAIPSALIQPNELTGAVRASSDARYIGEHPAERAGRFTLRSEVRISMGEDVRVDAFGLKGRITGGVGTTVETGEPPIGRGELSVAEGRYEAYGQELEISRGRLLYDASPLDDPGLDIEARRRVDATTVGLNVRGTLQDPRLTFFSDPSMPQTQILAYLLTGKSVDSMQSNDAETVRSVQDTLALQGGGLLASQIGRRVGLDEVGVESSIDAAGESNSSLVLGKFLSPRLFISYGISLTESINTLKLRYTISDRWVIRTEAGEHQSADVEFNIER